MKIHWWASKPYVSASDLHRFLDHVLTEAYSFSYIEAIRELDKMFDQIGKEIDFENES